MSRDLRLDAEIEFGKDDALYLLSRQDAPKGKILRLPLAEPDLAKAAVLRAEADLGENQRQLRLNEKLTAENVVSG